MTNHTHKPRGYPFLRPNRKLSYTLLFFYFPPQVVKSSLSVTQQGKIRAFIFHYISFTAIKPSWGERARHVRCVDPRKTPPRLMHPRRSSPPGDLEFNAVWERACDALPWVLVHISYTKR